LNAEQVAETRQNYRPADIVSASPALSAVMELLTSGHFNLIEPGIFEHIINAILSPHDQWMTAADFDDYCAVQQKVGLAYLDQTHWTQMSIRNTAASGRFSSDVTIAGYRDEIWRI